ncbi:VOC family protein [Amycolatopsis jiangsuensis]|uniref:VOC domain-containing protein n=1 Tax=Amycolatopsis jiangsuensis TaxID=1181879 RepID=A0A840J3K9_9PSEU|nr:VOC family protein [Amycolatopsis jiangsuensis]MBB4689651.1 hypothetical protein [Amycolatopsis jiangsuensis]
MPATLNHTIVFTNDKVSAAGFLSELLGIETTAWGPFVKVHVGETDLEFMNVKDAEWNDHVAPQHLCFLITEEEMDRVLERLEAHSVEPYTSPLYNERGVNHFYGGRGCYIRDIVDGHMLEFITAAYDDTPADVEDAKWRKAAVAKDHR